MTYYKELKIGRLYFKFIANTRLEELGYTSKILSSELDELGMIKLNDEKTHYTVPDGKTIKRSDLVRMIIEKNVA